MKSKDRNRLETDGRCLTKTSATGKHCHMERDCWWQKCENPNNTSPNECNKLQWSAASSLPQAPSIAPSQIEAFHVTSYAKPQEPWILSLDCVDDSERQEAEVDHPSRMDDYIKIDHGAAVSAAPNAFATHCHKKHGRQLTLSSATRHTPTYHGHRTVPLQFEIRAMVHSPFTITDTSGPLTVGERTRDPPSLCTPTRHTEFSCCQPIVML